MTNKQTLNLEPWTYPSARFLKGPITLAFDSHNHSKSISNVTFSGLVSPSVVMQVWTSVSIPLEPEVMYLLIPIVLEGNASMRFLYGSMLRWPCRYYAANMKTASPIGKAVLVISLMFEHKWLMNTFIIYLNFSWNQPKVVGLVAEQLNQPKADQKVSLDWIKQGCLSSSGV